MSHRLVSGQSPQTGLISLLMEEFVVSRRSADLATRTETVVGVWDLETLSAHAANQTELETIFPRPPSKLAATDRTMLPTADLAVSISEISPADFLVDLSGPSAATQHRVVSSAVAAATNGLVSDIFVSFTADPQRKEATRASFRVLDVLDPVIERIGLEHGAPSQQVVPAADSAELNLGIRHPEKQKSYSFTPVFSNAKTSDWASSLAPLCWPS